jgi:L-rhamnonate dehydratase
VKITDVRALQLRLSEVKDIFDGTQDVLLVEVESDEGLVGLGEVVSSSYVARAVIEAPASGGGRHGLASLLRGRDATDVEALWRVMGEGTSWYGGRAVAVHAMAGVDVALWDLQARASGRPLHAEISDRPAGPVRAYASVLWGDTLEETRGLAEELKRAGFRAVKFGFGPIGRRLEDDIAMVRAARDVLGQESDLMVDAGRRWSVEEAVERCHAFAEHGVAWVEEPLHPEDLAGYARLCPAVRMPIAAAETEETPERFRAFLDAGVRVVQPDLGRVGLTQALRISELARGYGAECVPHCFGTGVNTAVSIHWMVAVGGRLVEYPMRANALCRSVARGVPALEAGLVRPSRLPGSGVALDPVVVSQFWFGGRRALAPAADQPAGA